MFAVYTFKYVKNAFLTRLRSGQVENVILKLGRCFKFLSSTVLIIWGHIKIVSVNSRTKNNHKHLKTFCRVLFGVLETPKFVFHRIPLLYYANTCLRGTYSFLFCTQQSSVAHDRPYDSVDLTGFVRCRFLHFWLVAVKFERQRRSVVEKSVLLTFSKKSRRRIE